MKLTFSPEDEAFRKEIAGWLQNNLCDEFEPIRGSEMSGTE